MSNYTPAEEAIADAFADAYPAQDNLYEITRKAIEAVRAEAVEYVAQIAADTLRMCQRGGVGEKNILPLQQEVGFQLCIDNIANLAKSMKGEGQ